MYAGKMKSANITPEVILIQYPDEEGADRLTVLGERIIKSW